MEDSKIMTRGKTHTLSIALAGITAALYTVLTIFAASLNLASGVIQVRFSEALTILPFFGFAGVPGVTLGCLISNIIIGSNIFDIVFGTLATFIGAIGTWYIGVLFRKNGNKSFKFLSPVPPIMANTIIVPLILTYAYGVPDGIPFLMLTVGAGEVISCGVLGLLLLSVLYPIKNIIFNQNTHQNLL